MVGVLDCVSRFRFLPGVGVEDWVGVWGAGTEEGRFGVEGDAKDLRSYDGDPWKSKEKDIKMYLIEFKKIQ